MKIKSTELNYVDPLLLVKKLFNCQNYFEIKSFKIFINEIIKIVILQESDYLAEIELVLCKLVWQKLAETILVQTSVLVN
jgi:hypothetical protein